MKWLLFAWKNVLRNRRRALLALLIIAVGTAAGLIGGGFALFTYESLAEMTARDTGHVVVGHSAYFDDDEELPMQNGLSGAGKLTEKFAEMPGVRAVVPRLQFSGLISNGDKSTIFVGTGVDPESEFRLRGPQMTFVSGEVLSSPSPSVPEVVIGHELAKLMKAKPGSSLTLLATTTEGNLNAVDVTVKGIISVGVPDIDKRLVLTALPAAQKLLLTDKVSTLSLYIKDIDQTDTLLAQVKAAEPQLAAKTWLDLAVFYQSVKELYNRIFGILGAIMVVIILFAMINTLGMAVVERTREIGTLRAIGSQPGEIVRNFVLEGLVIGFGGALLGMIMALATTVFLMFANLQMPPPPGRSTGYALLVNYSTPLYLGATLAVLLVSGVAAWLVSAKAARKPITEALAHV